MNNHGNHHLKNHVTEFTHLSSFELLVLLGCIFSALLMFFRAFLGTELTDEAYYVSDAIAMIHGNTPYSLNNFSYGTGSAFLMIPPIFVYELIYPNHEGLLLFTRICFVSFRLICSISIYFLLKKHVKRSNAMLFSACHLTLNTVIVNYSYNTVPAVLFPLIAVILYDSIEEGERVKRFKLFVAGFLCGISVFANLGYASSVIFFIFLIIFRSRKTTRFSNILWFAIGGLIEIAVVFIPIACQEGIKALWNGIYSMFHSGFVSGPSRGLGRKAKAIVLIKQSWHMPLVFAIIVQGFYAFLTIPTGKRINTEDYDKIIYFGVACTICVYFLHFFINGGTMDRLCQMGILATILATIVFFSFGVHRINSLFWYLCIYPVIYVILELLAVSSNDTTFRFWACLPVLYALLLFLRERGTNYTRALALIGILSVILLQGYVSFRYPYRDAGIRLLTVRVESGVYKGIFTTAERAKDLPEMEEYINSKVMQDDYVAFRDNVPCGYLMLHQGEMCDLTTWDVLQYTYKKNYPSKLFDYYKRRNAIPTCIIYLDYGRDATLSAFDEDFRYNDFVNSYYIKEEDIILSGTFKRAVVFRYVGGFDGDFDYWIDTYNTIPKEASDLG
jgi:hypothetical protein